MYGLSERTGELDSPVILQNQAGKQPLKALRLLNIFPETSYVKSGFLPSMREFSVAISKKSDVIGDILVT